MPALRRPGGVAFAEPHAADLRLQRLRQGDVGHRRHGHASHPPAAQCVVLGGLAGCHPFQRHVGKTAAERTRHRVLRDRLAPVDEAQGGDDRARAEPAFRPGGGGRDDDPPFRSRADPPAGGQGRSHDGKLLLIGAVEIVSGKTNKLTLGRLRLAPIADFARTSLHAFIAANTAPGSIVKTDGLAAWLGPPNVAHEPHIVGTMAAHVVLPGIHRAFSNLKTWALGVCHGLRRKHLNACLDEFVFRFNRRHTRHASFASLLSYGRNWVMAL